VGAVQNRSGVHVKALGTLKGKSVRDPNVCNRLRGNKVSLGWKIEGESGRRGDDKCNETAKIRSHSGMSEKLRRRKGFMGMGRGKARSG